MQANVSKLSSRFLMAIVVIYLGACSKEVPDAPAPTRKLEPENPKVVDCEIGSDSCLQVLDCNTPLGACIERNIEFSVSDCSETEPREKCENFRLRLQDVSLIADAYNFVSSPLTDEKFSVEELDYKLTQPWDLEFLPDGSMLVTERKGKIIHLQNGEARKVHAVDTLVSVESGLLGLGVDPQFTENGYFYVFYTYQLDESDPAFLNPDHEHKRRILNRISRFTFKQGGVSDEVVILDAIPGSTSHTGGRLEFGPDGKLYASTGDAYLGLLSQDTSFLGGKILRLNTDGTVPEDNPIEGSYIYSLGHRNPQGLAWHPVSQALYQSEHGAMRFDEINRVTPGENYGWGSFKCDQKMAPKVQKESLTFPLVCFSSWTMAPSGMTFVSDSASPWYGSLFVAGLRGKHLHRFVFNQDDVVTDEIFYIRDGVSHVGGRKKGKNNPRLRDVEYHDGSLYIIGDQSRLTRVTPQ